MRTSAERADVIGGKRNQGKQWKERSVSKESGESTMTASRQSTRIVVTKRERKSGEEDGGMSMVKDATRIGLRQSWPAVRCGTDDVQEGADRRGRKIRWLERPLMTYWDKQYGRERLVLEATDEVGPGRKRVVRSIEMQDEQETVSRFGRLNA
ncbi:hypothetical protein PHSY_000874 [Pseudozyma hubeiensis SY62]|uniref:Uncharacterized protein n=1 Tax=Pseudozyma hubeiensis (strain SY62) TaxID=1305764 RepID=R9NXH3_PSEHS|nr:hypothetical protein PHSY_000874 [Pseudozyma hubeiensis SY62]GAC93309.1 hypothetical protein PHSY_000874 [Pseudozyma hubeiensis SY62]